MVPKAVTLVTCVRVRASRLAHLLGHHAALLVGYIVTFGLWDDPAELDWLPILAYYLIEQVLSVHIFGHTAKICILEIMAIPVSHIAKLALLGDKGNIFRFRLHHHFIGWDCVVVALLHHHIVADLLGLGDVLHLVVGLTVLPHRLNVPAFLLPGDIRNSHISPDRHPPWDLATHLPGRVRAALLTILAAAKVTVADWSLNLLAVRAAGHLSLSL